MCHIQDGKPLATIKTLVRKTPGNRTFTEQLQEEGEQCTEWEG